MYNKEEFEKDKKVVLIQGYGYVGKAYEHLLKDDHEVRVNDPHLGLKADFNDIDCAIIAVATPERIDQSLEMKNVYEAIEVLPDVPILIKSTISVEGWWMLKATFPDRSISFSPEFLREASWEWDVQFQDFFYLSDDDSDFWVEVLSYPLYLTGFIIKSAEELIVAKLMRNSFLALKVSFFNQCHDYVKELGLNFENIRDAVVSDERIGDSHSHVTERRGYGGHCFPKDVKGIISSAKKVNVNLSILEEADAYNGRIRKD